MDMKKRIVIAFFFLLSFELFAQPKLSVPLNIQSAFDKQTRSADGKPGKNCWQNTADYDLKIKPDTIDSDLPYFGRAYTAPIDPADAGIDFTSVKFDYNIVPGKKGGWEITIKPKDVTDINGMYLSISENGYALLRVNSNNRQAISFTGYIADKK